LFELVLQLAQIIEMGFLAAQRIGMVILQPFVEVLIEVF